MYGEHYNFYGPDGGADLSKNRIVRIAEKVSGWISMKMLTATLPTRSDGSIKREVRETARQLFNTADGLSDAYGRPEYSMFDDHRASDKPLSTRHKVGNIIAGAMIASGVAFVSYEVSEMVDTLQEIQTTAEQQRTTGATQWLENMRLGDPDFARIGAYEYEPSDVLDLPTFPAVPDGGMGVPPTSPDNK